MPRGEEWGPPYMTEEELDSFLKHRGYPIGTMNKELKKAVAIAEQQETAKKQITQGGLKPGKVKLLDEDIMANSCVSPVGAPLTDKDGGSPKTTGPSLGDIADTLGIDKDKVITGPTPEEKFRRAYPRKKSGGGLLPEAGFTPLNRGFPVGMTTEEKSRAWGGTLSAEEARSLVGARSTAGVTKEMLDEKFNKTQGGSRVVPREEWVPEAKMKARMKYLEEQHTRLIHELRDKKAVKIDADARAKHNEDTIGALRCLENIDMEVKGLHGDCSEIYEAIVINIGFIRKLILDRAL